MKELQFAFEYDGIQLYLFSDNTWIECSSYYEEYSEKGGQYVLVADGKK